VGCGRVSGQSLAVRTTDNGRSATDNGQMTTDKSTFEPRIVGFFCNWCSYRAADGAGTARIKYSPNVHVVRLMCSGRVDPTFVLEAFSRGADGVLIAGCHPGECHYIEQNYKTIRRFVMLRHTLEGLGIDGRRVRLVWASAAEGALLARTIDEMVEDICTLGPLHWSRNWAEDGTHLNEVACIGREHAEAMEVSP
jgi:F420-non-reducing hydrogenase iron-sulfur subunit